MLGFLPNRRHSSGGAFFRLSDLLRIPSVNCRLWMVSAHSLCRPDHSWHLPRNLGLKLPTVRTECISVFSVIGFLQACSRQSFTVWSPASLHPVGSPALSPPRSDHTPVGSWCFWRPCQPPTRRGCLIFSKSMLWRLVVITQVAHINDHLCHAGSLGWRTVCAVGNAAEQPSSALHVLHGLSIISPPLSSFKPSVDPLQSYQQHAFNLKILVHLGLCSSCFKWKVCWREMQYNVSSKRHCPQGQHACCERNHASFRRLRIHHVATTQVHSCYPMQESCANGCGKSWVHGR